MYIKGCSKNSLESGSIPADSVLWLVIKLDVGTMFIDSEILLDKTSDLKLKITS